MDDEVGTMKNDFGDWQEHSRVHVEKRILKAVRFS
jgi:hypothetical protein